MTLIYGSIWFVSRLMFWNWNAVQWVANQASIQPHEHRRGDVHRTRPEELHEECIGMQVCQLNGTHNSGKQTRVSLGDRHFNSGLIYPNWGINPLQSSSPSVVHLVSPPSPSSLCPILFRRLVVDWPFGVCQLRRLLRVGKNLAEDSRTLFEFDVTPARTSITFIYLHHSIWSPLHHRRCSVPSC